jgi:hypothetical protein
MHRSQVHRYRHVACATRPSFIVETGTNNTQTDFNVGAKPYRGRVVQVKGQQKEQAISDLPLSSILTWQYSLN